MAVISVAIYYNENWDESNKYSNFDVVGLLIPPSCKYNDLHGLVCSRLLWNPDSISTFIKFQIKPDIPPISVADESGFSFFLEVSTNVNEQFKFPLVVDKLEIHESLGDNTVLRPSLQDVTGSYSNQRELYVAPLDSREYQIRSDYSEQIATQIMEREEERQKYITFSEKGLDEIISEPNKYPVKVQQIFKDKKILIQAMRLHSIPLNRQHKVERSSSRDFVLVCVDSENCNCRFSASKYRKTNYFKVRNFKNQQSALSTFTVLSTTAETRLLRTINYSKKFKVETSNVLLFTVYDISRQYIVDMDRRSCTCNKFQYLEMPCAHAAAVIGKRNLSCYDYCSPLYTKTTLVATYSSSIMPMGDKDNWSVPADIENIIVLPPITRRPTGRPKKGRFKHVYELKKSVQVW